MLPKTFYARLWHHKLIQCAVCKSATQVGDFLSDIVRHVVKAVVWAIKLLIGVGEKNVEINLLIVV